LPVLYSATIESTPRSAREGDLRFITMELVEGETLGQLIGETGLPMPKFFELAIPLVEAVVAAHEGGVTHRDLKPSNVILAARAAEIAST
jgi:serine/threonine-protein kinase